ncbi:MAG: FAD-binding oxidoreductase [Geminicoccaceae bacterium]
MERFDIVIVGGGIAGASAGAALAPHRRVLLLERESQPGYHTTGRSAALLTPFYGTHTVRLLNLAGADFYREPPAGFADAPLLSPRGALYFGRPEDAEKVREDYEAALALCDEIVPLDEAGARALVPALRPGVVGSAYLDPTTADMDVGAILQGFLRQFRRAGGTVRTDAEVTAIERGGEGWIVVCGDTAVSAPIVIDAAGAWADTVAQMAGLEPIGIEPKRRTAMLIDPPAVYDTSRWPTLTDVIETFYVKPDAGRLMCSPADETPSPPMDAWPDEMDLAICAERVMEHLDLDIRRIEHKWAGLRSFAPDRTPVAGFDPRAEGFFWLAGQGGYGIMTAPSLAAVTAHLILGTALPERLEAAGFDLKALAPGRFLG